MPMRLKTEETMVYGPIEGQIGQRLDWDVFHAMEAIAELEPTICTNPVLLLGLITRKTKCYS